MLIKLKTLVVENHGYKREVTSKDVYVNTSHIISISDHHGIQDLLLTEDLSDPGDNFCVVRISTGNTTKEYITFGTSSSLYSEIQNKSHGKALLND